MQCVACGKTIPDSMAFCPYCGAAQTGGCVWRDELIGGFRNGVVF